MSEIALVEELPVLVVGAGPVGLALAVTLEHHGVDCRIIDRSDTPARLSKAAAIQARTIEILDELRLAGRFLELGTRITAAEVWSNDELVVALSSGGLALESRYPFGLGLPQSLTEELLTERLDRRGISVERGVELGECRQDERGVTALLHQRDGSCETVRARWLAGCDGAPSTVRDAARISFIGDEHRTQYAIGDIGLDWDQSPDTAMLLLREDGAMQLHPIGPGRWRIAVDRGPLRSVGRPTPPTAAELQRVCDTFLRTRTRITAVDWSTSYCVRRGRASRRRARRIFLLGDAAHVHPPLTLQGMNVGIEDAWNLGWKLALAERGAATDLLLESYDSERLRAAVEPENGPVEELFAPSATPPVSADDTVFPFLASLPGYQRHMAGRTASLDFAYRTSPAVGGYHGREGSAITRHPSARVHAGDLAPDPPFTTDSGVRIRDGRSYISLLFTGEPDDGDPGPLPEMPLPGQLPVRSVIVTRTPGVRSARSGTSIVTDSGGGIHQAWGIVTPTHVLVRPDGYVAWRAAPPDAGAVTTFLARLHGAPGPTRPPATDAARAERLAG
jgi:3-(3-hydroxy-phenyl)propionate hydroxylase